MKLQKKIAALFLIMLFFMLANAHESWLQPIKFFYNQGDTLRSSFKAGDSFAGKTLIIKSSEIKKLEIHNLTSTVSDLKPNLVLGQKEDFACALPKVGTHVIVMQTTNQFVETGSDQFNAYLKDEGLDDAAYKRKNTNELTKSGKENVQLCTKLIVQVGETKDDTYKKILGLPLEIIPGKNPYLIKVGELITFKILADGKPLFGVKVKVWNRENNRTIIQPAYTLQDGTIEARISSKGPWMVSVVKMIPSKDKGVDWQTYKGTLVFGVL